LFPATIPLMAGEHMDRPVSGAGAANERALARQFLTLFLRQEQSWVLRPPRVESRIERDHRSAAQFEALK
jgi:hypothetical protein